MRRIVLLLAAMATTAALPASAQEHHHSDAESASEAAAEATADLAGEHESHESELHALRIHGIGDLFVVPSGLPEELHEERVHLRNQLIAAFVNFTLLLVILFVKVRPLVRASLVERRATIAKDIEEAARLKAEAEAKHAEYKKRLAELDVEFAKIREDMLRAGKDEADRIVAEAQAKAERSRKETEFLIEQRVKALRSELTRETVVGAIAAAEKLLAEKTTADDQTRLSRGYVAKLGDVTANTTGGRA